MTLHEASVVLDLPAQTILDYLRCGFLDGHETRTGWYIRRESVERLAGRTLGASR